MPAQVVRHVLTDQKIIAVTFDDEGPPARIDAILTALRQANVRATMFLNGSWVAKNKDAVIRMAQAGHEVANHSYTHRNFSILSAAEIQRELERTDDAIAAAGVTPAQLFRPPYGSFNTKVLAAAGKAGFPYSILWSVDTKDWQGNSSSTINNSVLNKVKPGDIILMHLHGKHTAAALPNMIRELQKRGFQFVTVGELLASGTPSGAWRYLDEAEGAGK